MKIKYLIYILLTCYAATFLRISINNNLIVSIIGSFFFGCVISKRLNFAKKEIILSGFFSCFTSFSGYIYFLYKILNEEGFFNFVFWFNSIVILNLFTMYFGFWISRKIT